MARKKTTDTAALLSQTILFRVRQQEYEKLLKLAQNSDCRSVGEVVRRILEKRRIILFHRDTSLDGVVEELAGVREELWAIGVNINQITRHFNASTQAHKRVFLAQQALEQYRLGRAESQHVAHAPFSTSPPMVVRIITGKSIRGALRYNEHKVEEGQAALLLTHRFLQEPHTLRWEDKLRRFERLTGKNPRVKTNCVHISLNFAIGEELSKERLQHIATDYMDRIGFGGSPTWSTSILDAAHPHLHIVTTNLQPDGKRINLHNLGRNRSEPARKALEMAYGLKPAEGQKEMNLDAPLRLPLSPARYGASETKRSIAHIVSVVTRTYSYTSLAELNAALGAFRVQADRGGEQTQMFRRGGLHYRLLDQLGQAVGVPLKASSLPGKPTLAALEKRFAQHKLLRKPLRDKLRQTLDETLQTDRPHDRASLAACLERVQGNRSFSGKAAEGRCMGEPSWITEKGGFQRQ